MKILDLEPSADEAAELLSTMGNPKRLLILCHLLDRELSVGELSGLVGLAQSPLSQHLAKLRALRMVRSRRDGQSMRYRLASPKVGKVLATLHGIYCETKSGAPSSSATSRSPK